MSRGEAFWWGVTGFLVAATVVAFIAVIRNEGYANGYAVAKAQCAVWE